MLIQSELFLILSLERRQAVGLTSRWLLFYQLAYKPLVAGSNPAATTIPFYCLSIPNITGTALWFLVFTIDMIKYIFSDDSFL